MHNNLLLAQPSDEKLYVEDVFSTYLYTGNGSTQTITNGIDLAGKGGLVWLKARTGGNLDHVLYDTARTTNARLITNTTAAQTTQYPEFTSFNSNGFSFYNNIDGGYINQNGLLHASWTFRKAPKFFDVVTYTGNGALSRQISHALGTTPGMVIVKCTSATTNWTVWHRSTPVANDRLLLNLTNAVTGSASDDWGGSSGTFNSTVFTVGSLTGTGGLSNASGASYVAYLFAHDTTADGVIQCGSVTQNSNGTWPQVNLGWEPQWMLVKSTNGNGTGYQGWTLWDNMRGIDKLLQPNSSAADVDYGGTSINGINATGFKLADGYYSPSPATAIYVAIRRGPMRVPTDATKVFAPVTTNAANNPQGNFPLDLWWLKARNASELHVIMDRLRSPNVYLDSSSTARDGSNPNNYYRIDNMTGGYSNGGSYSSYQHWLFRRAPGFFDVVCYTGTGGSNTINHNLGVVPEMIIVKRRNGAASWTIGTQSIGVNDYLTFSTSSFNPDGSASQYWGSSWPSKTSLNYTGGYGNINSPGATYVAYLFASCPGVSKVGSYTGNGSSLNIDCGFTNGARFVLIKRTDSTGDWYVWDTARGIVAANDPHLSLNSSAAEVTTNDSIDPLSTGFTVNQDSATNVNVNAATYIYLAIA